MDQTQDSDDDIHICGSCRAEFSDVEVFVEHKKHQCPVKLARKQKLTVNSSSQKNQLVIPDNSGIGQNEVILQSSTGLPDTVMSQFSKGDNHIAIQLSQDGTLGYFPVHAPLQGNVPHTVEPSQYPSTEFFNQGCTGTENQEYVILPNSTADLQNYNMSGYQSQASTETLYTLDSHTAPQVMDTGQETENLAHNKVFESQFQVQLQGDTGQGDFLQTEPPASQTLTGTPFHTATGSTLHAQTGPQVIPTQTGGSVSVEGENEKPVSKSMKTVNILSRFTKTAALLQEPQHGDINRVSSEATDSDFKYTMEEDKLKDEFQKNTSPANTTTSGNTNVAEKTTATQKLKLPLKKKFHCKYENCKYRTAYIKDLERHTRIHTGERPYKCDRCDKAFHRSDKLMLHLRYHMNDKPFKCDLCSYRAVENGSLKKHMKTHSQYDERPFCCQVCSYKCRSQTQLQIHLRTHTGDTPFHCKTCDAVFKVNSDLKRHTRVHTGEKPFQCNYTGCDYRCAIKSNLQSHYRTHHKDDTLECSVCDFKTSSKKSIQEHLKSHSFNADLTCELCSYQCASRSALRNHRKIHLTEKPFKCNFCTYRSSQRGNVQTHMQRKHPNSYSSKSGETNSRKSKLEERKLKFKIIKQIGKNPDKENPEEMTTKENLKTKCVKNFKCDQCTAAFVREDSLTAHLKQHKDSSLSTAYAVLKLQQPVINTSKGQEIVQRPPQRDQSINEFIKGQLTESSQGSESSQNLKLQSEISPNKSQTSVGQFQQIVTSPIQSAVTQGHIGLASPVQNTMFQGQQVSLGINDILMAAGMSGLNSSSNSPTAGQELAASPPAGSLRSNALISTSPQQNNSAVPNTVVGQSSQDVPSLQVMQNISLPYIRLPNGQVLILTGQTSINQLPSSQTCPPVQADGTLAAAITAEIQSQLLVQQPEMPQDQIVQCAADSTTSVTEGSSIQTSENLASQQGAIPIQIILPSDSQQALPLVSQLLNSVVNRSVDDAGNQNQAPVQTSNQSAGSQTVQNFVLQIPAQAGALKDASGISESQSYVLQIPGTNFN